MSEKVKYKIPAGTQPNTVFRLKGKGVKAVRGNKTGDLYVKVNLEVPTKLNGAQKDKIREFSKSIDKSAYANKSKFTECVKKLLGD
jgi:molecular chaperone DnaJ